jgi:hypothetical protein
METKFRNEDKSPPGGGTEVFPITFEEAKQFNLIRHPFQVRKIGDEYIFFFPKGKYEIAPVKDIKKYIISKKGNKPSEELKHLLRTRGVETIHLYPYSSFAKDPAARRLDNERKRIFRKILRKIKKLSVEQIKDGKWLLEYNCKDEILKGKVLSLISNELALLEARDKPLPESPPEIITPTIPKIEDIIAERFGRDLVPLSFGSRRSRSPSPLPVHPASRFSGSWKPKESTTPISFGSFPSPAASVSFGSISVKVPTIMKSPSPVSSEPAIATSNPFTPLTPIPETPRMQKCPICKSTKNANQFEREGSPCKTCTERQRKHGLREYHCSHGWFFSEKKWAKITSMFGNEFELLMKNNRPCPLCFECDQMPGRCYVETVCAPHDMSDTERTLYMNSTGTLSQIIDRHQKAHMNPDCPLFIVEGADGPFCPKCNTKGKYGEFIRNILYRSENRMLGDLGRHDYIVSCRKCDFVTNAFMNLYNGNLCTNCGFFECQCECKSAESPDGRHEYTPGMKSSKYITHVCKWCGNQKFVETTTCHHKKYSTRLIEIGNKRFEVKSSCSNYEWVPSADVRDDIWRCTSCGDELKPEKYFETLQRPYRPFIIYSKTTKPFAIAPSESYTQGSWVWRSWKSETQEYIPQVRKTTGYRNDETMMKQCEPSMLPKTAEQPTFDHSLGTVGYPLIPTNIIRSFDMDPKLDRETKANKGTFRVLFQLQMVPSLMLNFTEEIKGQTGKKSEGDLLRYVTPGQKEAIVVPIKTGTLTDIRTRCPLMLSALARPKPKSSFERDMGIYRNVFIRHNPYVRTCPSKILERIHFDGRKELVKIDTVEDTVNPDFSQDIHIIEEMAFEATGMNAASSKLIDERKLAKAGPLQHPEMLYLTTGFTNFEKSESLLRNIDFGEIYVADHGMNTDENPCSHMDPETGELALDFPDKRDATKHTCKICKTKWSKTFQRKRDLKTNKEFYPWLRTEFDDYKRFGDLKIWYIFADKKILARLLPLKGSFNIIGRYEDPLGYQAQTLCLNNDCASHELNFNHRVHSLKACIDRYYNNPNFGHDPSKLKFAEIDESITRKETNWEDKASWITGWNEFLRKYSTDDRFPDLRSSIQEKRVRECLTHFKVRCCHPSPCPWCLNLRKTTCPYQLSYSTVNTGNRKEKELVYTCPDSVDSRHLTEFNWDFIRARYAQNKNGGLGDCSWDNGACSWECSEIIIRKSRLEIQRVTLQKMRDALDKVWRKREEFIKTVTESLLASLTSVPSFQRIIEREINAGQIMSTYSDGSVKPVSKDIKKPYKWNIARRSGALRFKLIAERKEAPESPSPLTVSPVIPVPTMPNPASLTYKNDPKDCIHDAILEGQVCSLCGHTIGPLDWQFPGNVFRCCVCRKIIDNLDRIVAYETDVCKKCYMSRKPCIKCKIWKLFEDYPSRIHPKDPSKRQYLNECNNCQLGTSNVRVPPSPRHTDTPRTPAPISISKAVPMAIGQATHQEKGLASERVVKTSSRVDDVNEYYDMEKLSPRECEQLIKKYNLQIPGVKNVKTKTDQEGNVIYNIVVEDGHRCHKCTNEDLFKRNRCGRKSMLNGGWYPRITPYKYPDAILQDKYRLANEEASRILDAQIEMNKPEVIMLKAIFGIVIARAKLSHSIPEDAECTVSWSGYSHLPAMLELWESIKASDENIRKNMDYRRFIDKSYYIHGPWGTGKSYQARRFAKPDDLIVVATRELVLEYLMKLAGKYKLPNSFIKGVTDPYDPEITKWAKQYCGKIIPHIKTYEIAVEFEELKPTSIVWFDECHLNSVGYAIKLETKSFIAGNNYKANIFVGDHLQVKAVDFNHINGQRPLKIVRDFLGDIPDTRKHLLNVTFRNAADTVAYMISNFGYPETMRTATKVLRSFEEAPNKQMPDGRYRLDVKGNPLILAHYNDNVQDLKANDTKRRVTTSHRAQGSETDHVIVYDVGRTPSSGHSVVILTRHKKTCGIFWSGKDLYSDAIGFGTDEQLRSLQIDAALVPKWEGFKDLEMTANDEDDNTIIDRKEEIDGIRCTCRSTAEDKKGNIYAHAWHCDIQKAGKNYVLIKSSTGGQQLASERKIIPAEDILTERNYTIAGVTCSTWPEKIHPGSHYNDEEDGIGYYCDQHEEVALGVYTTETWTEAKHNDNYITKCSRCLDVCLPRSKMHKRSFNSWYCPDCKRKADQAAIDAQSGGGCPKCNHLVKQIDRDRKCGFTKEEGFFTCFCDNEWHYTDLPKHMVPKDPTKIPISTKGIDWSSGNVIIPGSGSEIPLPPKSPEHPAGFGEYDDQPATHVNPVPLMGAWGAASTAIRSPVPVTPSSPETRYDPALGPMKKCSICKVERRAIAYYDKTNLNSLSRPGKKWQSTTQCEKCRQLLLKMRRRIIENKESMSVNICENDDQRSIYESCSQYFILTFGDMSTKQQKGDNLNYVRLEILQKTQITETYEYVLQIAPESSVSIKDGSMKDSAKDKLRSLRSKLAQGSHVGWSHRFDEMYSGNNINRSLDIYEIQMVMLFNGGRKANTKDQNRLENLVRGDMKGYQIRGMNFDTGKEEAIEDWAVYLTQQKKQNTPLLDIVRDERYFSDINGAEIYKNANYRKAEHCIKINYKLTSDQCTQNSIVTEVSKRLFEKNTLNANRPLRKHDFDVTAYYMDKVDADHGFGSSHTK